MIGVITTLIASIVEQEYMHQKVDVTAMVIQIYLILNRKVMILMMESGQRLLLEHVM